MTCTVVENITKRAAEITKRICLPETEDDRVVQAAGPIIEKKYAQLVLLGEESELKTRAEKLGVSLDGAEFVNPETDPNRQNYIDALVEKRKHKGMDADKAADLLGRGVYYAGQMVAAGAVDGMVAGSNCPTADTVRSALWGPGLADGCKTVSSCSIMNTIVEQFGVDGSVIFADTGVVPEPTAEQLADIAIAAGKCCRSLLGVEPLVAMISFSTKGSADSPAVEKVREATKIAQDRDPGFAIDGELQVDAAMVESVGKKKAPDSPVAGKANVLVFPDLSCGNSAYKLVERFGRATALGPLLLGLSKPINDLSRGCSVDDIVLVTAITACQLD
ncbi:MAG: phosphate acetyltransferase [Phycisphaerae bacterium]